MSRKYSTLDVFTDTALGGNPLAVVVDGGRLDDKQMQRIAGEFNLSETVFVTSQDATDCSADIRIFTPKNELPFAGHPTVGTAVLLAKLNGLSDGGAIELTLNEKVGPVTCHVSQAGQLATAIFALPKLPKVEEVDFNKELLAKALGINENQLGMEGHGNSVCNAGVPFPTVPLVDLDAMAAINMNEIVLEECFEDLGFAVELYVYTKQCVNADSDYHVRLFAPAMGIAEDPATGSAAAGFAGQIMKYDKPEDGQHVFIIEQGIEMGRPSRIELSMSVENGQLVSAGIGGNAVIVGEGQLYL